MLKFSAFRRAIVQAVKPARLQMWHSTCEILLKNRPQIYLNLSKSNRFLCSGSSTPFTRKSRKNNLVGAFSFNEEYNKALIQISSAMKPLKELNANFEVKLENEMLEISTLRGKLVVKSDLEEQQLIVVSYLSGYHKYAFEPEERLWLSIKDNHDMRGLITRDLLRHCAGCAQF